MSVFHCPSFREPAEMFTSIKNSARISIGTNSSPVSCHGSRRLHLLKITLCLALFWCLFFPSIPPSVALAQTPKQAKDGYVTLFEVSGDLNNDGLNDLVQVLESTGENEPREPCSTEDDYSDAPARRLVISLADASGKMNATLDEPRLLLRKDEGGVFGDPLEEVSIENGTLLIHTYGGSRWRWGHKLRFRLDSEHWNLIGYSEFHFDSAGGSGVYYDYNPLTHKLKVNVETPEEPERRLEYPACVQCPIGKKCPTKENCEQGSRRMSAGEYWYDLPKKPLVRLVDYHCWQSETGFFKHIEYIGFR